MKKQKMNKGGKNLVILGICSTLIALVTTGVSLIIYHNSGDIYLDRSRPGYLPDETEAKQENEEEELNYAFDKNGKLTVDIVSEYLEKLKIEVDAIDVNGDAFSAGVLSDDELDIPSE